MAPLCITRAHTHTKTPTRANRFQHTLGTHHYTFLSSSACLLCSASLSVKEVVCVRGIEHALQTNTHAASTYIYCQLLALRNKPQKKEMLTCKDNFQDSFHRMIICLVSSVTKKLEVVSMCHNIPLL